MASPVKLLPLLFSWCGIHTKLAANNKSKIENRTYISTSENAKSSTTRI